MNRLLPLALLLLASTAPGAGDPFAAFQFVDLTHAYSADTLYWPTAPSRFELTRLAHGETEGGYFYAANSLCTPEHGGTHLDAPLHFHRDGQSTDQVPLEQLIGPAVVIDITVAAQAELGYRLRRTDIEAFEAVYGTIPAGAIVLLRTGWSQRWPDARGYLGDDTPGDASRLQFPSYGAEAAELLIAQRKVAMLGIDTASIDYGQSQDYPVHRIAARHNVSGLENLTGLERVPASGAYIIALPMKIAGGSGGPTRVIALVPRT